MARSSRWSRGNMTTQINHHTDNKTTLSHVHYGRGDHQREGDREEKEYVREENKIYSR